MSSKAQRLADAVTARREELDVTQLEVWQSGGPSNTTLTRIENADIETLTRTTARKLDVGLRWAPGSAKAVWERGEEPRPDQGVTHREATWLAEQIRSASVDQAVKDQLLKILRERGSA